MSYSKISIKKIIIIGFVAVFIAILFNTFSGTGIPLFRSKEIFTQVNDSTFLSIQNNSFIEPQIISIQQAYNLFEKNNAVFIDARDKWDYAEGHIKSAINIPQYKFDTNDIKLRNLNKDIVYVIYCNDDDCDTSKRLAKDLMKLSFKKLYIFEEGWNGWVAANFPYEKSEME